MFSSIPLLPLAAAAAALVLAVACRRQGQRWLVRAAARPVTGRRATRLTGDAGQTTAEYALVIVGAAALALLLITWATKSDAIGKLFDFVLQSVKGRIG